jgi:hypothetical protein
VSNPHHLLCSSDLILASVELAIVDWIKISEPTYSYTNADLPWQPISHVIQQLSSQINLTFLALD